MGQLAHFAHEIMPSFLHRADATAGRRVSVRDE
jgi:hypothetical protein